MAPHIAASNIAAAAVRGVSKCGVAPSASAARHRRRRRRVKTAKLIGHINGWRQHRGGVSVAAREKRHQARIKPHQSASAAIGSQCRSENAIASRRGMAAAQRWRSQQ